MVGERLYERGMLLATQQIAEQPAELSPRLSNERNGTRTQLRSFIHRGLYRMVPQKGEKLAARHQGCG